jgi:hypothetical protein
MTEFVIKGRLTLERVTFYVSAKTLEGALARAANGDFDGYDTDAAVQRQLSWPVVLPHRRMFPNHRALPHQICSRCLIALCPSLSSFSFS